MKDPESRTIFAGVDGRTDTELPEWYRQRHRDADPVTFAEAVRDLPQVVETAVAYQNPYTDEWVETERFNALVEPSRARSQVREADADCLFDIPTDSYTIINPVGVYGPLEEVLREETIDGTPLGDVMFGEIRRYRGGGEVHMDVMFDGLEVRLPGRSEPITMGVTSGYDFFGEHAVYVEGSAQDGYCSNSRRSLTDKEVIKHVGDVRNFRTWWEELLARVELVADDLFEYGSLAVTSTGAFIGNADEMNHRRREFEKTRGSMQQTGTRSAHLSTQSMNDREHRWMQDELHRASNQILDEAREHECTHVAFENLTDIRDRVAGVKRFHAWAFCRLFEYVEYKTETFGLKLEQVSPAYTSQRCSSCGFTHESNRRSTHQFVCRKCEYELNADYNASKNIARKLLKRLHSGQTSSSGGVPCQCALKSGMLKLNGDYTASVKSTAEGEHTDKPTNSVVGY